jgi:hypothetical protein
MKEGLDWEKFVHVYLANLPLSQVEPFGQALLGPLAREAIHQKPTLLRWLPDFLLKQGDNFVWVEAKKSPGVERYGNHSCEDSSTKALQQIAFETGHSAVYAFWHPDNQPRFISLDTWLNYRERRSFSGQGSGTPFHVISCAIHCKSDIHSTLTLQEGAA